ncbi:MAG: UDP-2,3-diacylglucosamine diphosphatase [Bacteroidales bacterium]|nr:UDP-2,3-diacylglucosamine diphosphatase [Bacteroidales bacterium]
MKQNLVFISDAHLGSGTDTLQRERQLCQLLNQIEPTCRTLVLLGDMFDFWFTYRHVVPKGHTRLIGTLANMADKGTEIHFFIGNHDMWLFDYLHQECGIIMHSEPERFTFGEKTFLVGHGDGLGHLDRAYDFVSHFFRSRTCQRLFSMLPPALTIPFARRWSNNNKRKHLQQDCDRYLGDDREGIVIYCKQQIEKCSVDYCVFGHRHTPLTMPISNTCTYVNTGDWLTHRTYAVFIPGETLQLLSFES